MERDQETNYKSKRRTKEEKEQIYKWSSTDNGLEGFQGWKADFGGLGTWDMYNQKKACTEKIVNSEIREKVDWYCKQSSEYRIPNYQTVTYNIYVCGSFTFTYTLY